MCHSPLIFFAFTIHNTQSHWLAQTLITMSMSSSGDASAIPARPGRPTPVEAPRGGGSEPPGRERRRLGRFERYVRRCAWTMAAVAALAALSASAGYLAVEDGASVLDLEDGWSAVDLQGGLLGRYDGEEWEESGPLPRGPGSKELDPAQMAQRTEVRPGKKERLVWREVRLLGGDDGRGADDPRRLLRDRDGKRRFDREEYQRQNNRARYDRLRARQERLRARTPGDKREVRRAHLRGGVRGPETSYQARLPLSNRLRKTPREKH